MRSAAALVALVLLLGACPGGLPPLGDGRRGEGAVDLGTKPEGVTPGKEQGVTPGKEQGVTPGKEQGVTPGKEAGIVPPAGLGGKCSQTKPCIDPLGCLFTKVGATEGYCTKECPLADYGGKPCAGAPAGTGLFCIYGDAPTPKKAFCGFICQVQDGTKLTTYACPPELKCGPLGGDGLAVCE